MALPDPEILLPIIVFLLRGMPPLVKSSEGRDYVLLIERKYKCLNELG